VKFGWWTTGRDEAAIVLLRTVIHSIKMGVIPNGEISYVFCSREPGESKWSDSLMAFAQSYDIPVVSFSAKNFRPRLRASDKEYWRVVYHKQVLERISNFDVDLVVLAGYMWVVSSDICNKLSIINLHPALPGGPTGTWQEVIWKLLEQEADETGVMMHLVTPELDKGPAITYCHFPIKGKKWDKLWEQFRSKRDKIGLKTIIEQEGEKEPLFSAIREEGVKRELPLIVQTLRAFSTEKIALKDGKLYDSNGNELLEPYDLTKEIEKMIE